MTRWLLSGVLVVTLAGFAEHGMDAAAVAPSAEMKTQVFRYLDSTDTDEAARTLQAMLSDPNATIDQAIRIIQTERDYAPQPNGTIPDERIDVQGRAYHLALSIPLPYTPRWNGKAERFIQTLQNEWAYAHRWESSSQRARALSSFVRYYNRFRPHSSLRDRPPISRVHNLRGQDT